LPQLCRYGINNKHLRKQNRKKGGAMVQSGDDYREKNRKRLQRFYERQKAEGKKRLSILLSANAYIKLRSDRDSTGKTLNAIIENAILEYGADSNTVQVSDDIHSRLMDEKDKTGVSLSEIIKKALNRKNDPQGMTHFKESSAGHNGILDVDDMSEEYLTACGGPDPKTPSDEPQEQGVVEPEPTDTGQRDDIDQDLETDQGDPVIDETAGQDQAEPAILVESDTNAAKPVTETLPKQEPDQTNDPDTAQGNDDLIPDCTGREITRDERDKILVRVAKEYRGNTKEIVQTRVDLLNRKKIPVCLKPSQYGGEWDRKKFTDNLWHAKKRLRIK